MKKLLITIVLLFIFIGYSINQQTEGKNIQAIVAKSSTPSGSNGSPSPSNAGSSPSTNSGNVTTGSFKDGTYVGNSADAYYGNIQVQATISNGKLVDVQFLKYPNDRGTSIEINSAAMPILKQEAIQAQSANVGAVSGATDTSMAFVQSLSSALVKAQ